MNRFLALALVASLLVIGGATHSAGQAATTAPPVACPPGDPLTAGNWLADYQRAPLPSEFWDVVSSCLMTTQYLTAELDRSEASIGDTLTLTLRLPNGLDWCSPTLPRQRPCVDGVYDLLLNLTSVGGTYRVVGDEGYACNPLVDCDPVLRPAPPFPAAGNSCAWGPRARSASCQLAVERRTYPPGTPEQTLRIGWYAIQGDISVDLNPDPLSSQTLGARIPAEAAFFFQGEAPPDPEPDPGTIVVVKETDPPTAAKPFAFEGSGPIGTFSLDTDPASATPDRRTFADLDAGSYTITETLPDGWRLAAVTCVDPSGGTTTSLPGARATVDLTAGETVTCTFRNRERTALVVNSESGAIDDNPGDGACDTSGTILRSGAEEPECTLRAAIEEANASTGADTITFDVPGVAVPTIGVAQPLTATETVKIDGTTQPGGGRVELDGLLRDGAAQCRAEQVFRDGLRINGGSSTVRGLVVHSFPGYGIVLAGTGDHTLQSSVIGADPTGSRPLGNGLACTLQFEASPDQLRGGGILVQSAGNLIGGQGLGNQISGNSMRHPYETQDAFCDSLPHVGLLIRGALASGTIVEGNIIGLDAGGVRHLGDRVPQSSCSSGTQYGIIVEGAANTRIGGQGAARNVIASGQCGVLTRADATGTTIEGNALGTDEAGTADATPDSSGLLFASGICLFGSSDRVVRNVISGNDFGIEVGGRDSVVVDNRIGVGATTDAPLANDRAGVLVTGDDNLIQRNTIAFAAEYPDSTFGQGIAVAAGSGNTLTENRLFGNGGLGIDLGGIDERGVTLNDASFDLDSGPNGLQNFPLIGGAAQTPTGVRLHGSLDSAASSTFTIEAFASSDCDDSGHGEGARFLGRFEVTTSILGTALIEHHVAAPVRSGEVVTTTATDASGNTSEFSPCRVVLEDLLRLSQAAAAGATRLEVAADRLVGKVIAIGEGAARETNYATAIGSLVLARPTRFAHPAGEAITALDDTLFVSLDRVVITRSSRLPDVAVLSGRVRAVAGRTIACGEDVTLTLDGATVAQKVPGTRFTRQSGNRCVFVAKTENGIGRLELDLGRGTWNAQVIRRDLERLTNPVDVGLTIGDDSGSEELRFRITRGTWRYAR